MNIEPELEKELELMHKELTTLRNRVQRLLTNKPKKKVDYTEVDYLIDQLNLIAKKSYTKNQDNRKYFLARLRDGHTADDIKRVISFKTRQWTGTKMASWLRPSTLMSPSKFQGYLEEAKLAKPVRDNSLVSFV